MTSVSFDRVADEYDQTRGGEPRGRAVAEALNPLFARDGLTLEIGVGTGLVALGLARLGRRVIGVDLSAPMLARAKSRGVPVARGDAMRLPLRDSSVDDAYAVWVLHLVADMGVVLAELARALRPGGRCLIVVTTPRSDDDEDPVSRAVAAMGDALRGRPRPDDPDSVRALAEAAGLSFVRTEHVVGGEFEESPNDIADRIAARTYSVLWNATDEQWRDVVEPTLATLRALPDPDVKRSKRYRAVLVVLEKPETV